MRKLDYRDIETLKRVIAESDSITDVVTRMGYHPRAGSVNKNVSALIKAHDIDISHFRYQTWVKQEELLRELISQSYSHSEVLRKLSLRDKGSNYATLKRYIEIHDIDASHFCQKRASFETKQSRGSHTGYPLDEILEGLHRCKIASLKRRLIEAGIKTHQCEKCGLKDWNAEPITIELDHIDGDNLNHKLENLRMLCPNCHSQTPTYKGKNKRDRS